MILIVVKYDFWSSIWPNFTLERRICAKKFRIGTPLTLYMLLSKAVANKLIALSSVRLAKNLTYRNLRNIKRFSTTTNTSDFANVTLPQHLERMEREAKNDQRELEKRLARFQELQEERLSRKQELQEERLGRYQEQMKDELKKSQEQLKEDLKKSQEMAEARLMDSEGKFEARSLVSQADMKKSQEMAEARLLASQADMKKDLKEPRYFDIFFMASLVTSGVACVFAVAEYQGYHVTTTITAKPKY